MLSQWVAEALDWNINIANNALIDQRNRTGMANLLGHFKSLASKALDINWVVGKMATSERCSSVTLLRRQFSFWCFLLFFWTTSAFKGSVSEPPIAFCDASKWWGVPAHRDSSSHLYRGLTPRFVDTKLKLYDFSSKDKSEKDIEETPTS